MSSNSRSPLREASSPSLTMDDFAGPTDRLGGSAFPKRQELAQPRDTLSYSGKGEKNDPRSRGVCSIKATCDDYAPTLPLLSRLNQECTHTADVEEMKAGIKGPVDGELGSYLVGRFSMPGSVCEAGTSGDVCREMAFGSRKKRLGDSDLSLSLGICKEKRPKHTFDCALFPHALSNRTNESSHKQLPLQRQYTGYLSDADEIKAGNKSLESAETPPAQLTILYGSSVFVYNNVPLEKVRAIMLLAESANGCLFNTNQAVESQFVAQGQCFDTSQCMPRQTSSSSALDTVPPREHDIERPSSSVASKTTSEFQPVVRVSYTALPQARKISLQRFLQKRIERSREVSPHAAPKSLEVPLRNVQFSPSATDSRTVLSPAS